jgi:hypothetical protein
MWANHDQFECVGIFEAISQEILSCLDFEFVNEDTVQLTPFLLTDPWIVGYLPDLLVQDPLLLFPEASDSLLKAARLDDSHRGSSKPVFARLTLFQFLNTDQDVPDEEICEIRILFRTLSDPCPVFYLAGYGSILDSAYKARFAHQILRDSNCSRNAITSFLDHCKSITKCCNMQRHSPTSGQLRVVLGPSASADLSRP